MSEVRAYRGYYVNMDNIIPVITQLLADADLRKKKIVIIGNDERAKLDGAIMSLRALKEALYNLEVFGDLIPQPDPVNEEVAPNEKVADQVPVKDPVDVVPESPKDKPV
jgi:hypothetical protein